ncbi:hypothetical protein [Halalkalicoccus ordinarius]|uniref:hypothetical protein n=1 Tax=Halalkalicoccus ordinarius TaxID=3116651 RepID=UPI00300F4FCD
MARGHRYGDARDRGATSTAGGERESAERPPEPTGRSAASTADDTGASTTEGSEDRPGAEETVLVRLPELLEVLSVRLEALKSAIVAEADDETVIEIAEGLWTIVDEALDVLETIDFEELPDAIDFEEFPDAIEAEKFSSAIQAGDAARAIDLAELYEAVDLRELWRAVDLTSLRKEERELREEIERFLEENGEAIGADDGSASDDDENGESDLLRNTANAFLGAESRQQALQQRIGKAIDAFRVALLETHATIRDLYEANQRKLGGSGRHSGSRNPTARSTRSRGPLPDSISTRVSTVPRRVRHSRTKPRPRIYGRRFERVRR